MKIERTTAMICLTIIAVTALVVGAVLAKSGETEAALTSFAVATGAGGALGGVITAPALSSRDDDRPAG